MIGSQAGVESIDEGFVVIDGEQFYAIPSFDELGPFLMTILSDDDHWMFVSSRGGLTAGRGDANSALFPYETDDRLHVAAGVTGPVTLIRCEGGPPQSTWEPFTGRPSSVTKRNLYKSIVGNQVVFEEVNHDLELVFRYRWANSDRFGFVRTASLRNLGEHAIALELVDGLLNVLPDGLHPPTYRVMSNLTNAYKRSEIVDEGTRLAVFSLESQIVDRPEPAESLSSSVVWSFGLEDAGVTVDAASLDAFRAGPDASRGALVTGRPGAYLLVAHKTLQPNASAAWTIVADVAKSQSDVVELNRFLRSGANTASALTASIERGTETLVSLVASADGLQSTGDTLASAHHFANVAFNVMRGGIPVSGTDIDRDDWVAFVAGRNRAVATRHQAFLASLPASVDKARVLENAQVVGDPQLIRLTLEYLPFTFSRRHGDPSRPWNSFAMRVRDSAGRPVVHYEGNWRDIFQNWEALCMSFPSYLPSIMSVFLNASTADGFNPYRITSEGIEWEVPDADNPWSNIGYWGDHQIVYLLRLLEMTRRYLPSAVDEMLASRWFAYADSPYRIAPYEDILADPRATIEYDALAAERTQARVAHTGLDGKLVPDSDGSVYLVTMVEKLLVSALSKLSNFVPGGGIWMNTQRPEWNDANNALVGNGLSMVTTCYLRQYLHHLVTSLKDAGLDTVEMSIEVADWLSAVSRTLTEHTTHIGGDLTGTARRAIVDSLGVAFSRYRGLVYASGFSGTTSVDVPRIFALLDAAIGHLDDTIRRNTRPEGLYHSYNLLHVSTGGDTASVEHLGPMLEGQVAALSCGLLSAEEKAELLDCLFDSALYRSDQNSFMLYPVRELPSFLDKNVIPSTEVAGSDLVGDLIAAGDTSVVELDGDGRYRFNSSFRNRRDLVAALDRLAQDVQWRGSVSLNRESLVNTYERVFNHHAYTGRSASMYAYEGIGSIYWHMVAKLLVAVQESVVDARRDGASAEAVQRLIGHYWRVRGGLGFEKSAVEFGAFPTDPYSHTPAHAGAQQPGMTGQVKEEILTRLLELGLRVHDGEVQFDPTLLRVNEFQRGSQEWRVCNVDGGGEVRQLPPNSLGFTFCQVPVVVSLGSGPAFVDVQLPDGQWQRTGGLTLDRKTSAAILGRSGRVAGLCVSIPQALLEGPFSTT